MKILITGNLGYVGTVLTSKIINLGHEVTGLDIGYYKDCYLVKPIEAKFQITKDIRFANKTDVANIDLIIHLAALSNDPLGELAPGITKEINFQATLNLAKLAKESGVKRFIYISSQSMYGISNTNEALDEDSGKKNAITEYAKTKWEAEQSLKDLVDSNYCITFLRPSTVFGSSPRLRSDIVFNNLLGCAYTTGKIEIKSDGTPIRPVLHINDLCGFIIACIDADQKIISKRAFNLGIKDGNYTVKHMADMVQKLIPDAKIFYLKKETQDERTYKVSFDRAYRELGHLYTPSWNLEKGGRELLNFFKKINFQEKDFKGEKTNRLKQINNLINKNKINNKLIYI